MNDLDKVLQQITDRCDAMAADIKEINETMAGIVRAMVLDSSSAGSAAQEDENEN